MHPMGLSSTEISASQGYPRQRRKAPSGEQPVKDVDAFNSHIIFGIRFEQLLSFDVVTSAAVDQITVDQTLDVTLDGLRMYGSVIGAQRVTYVPDRGLTADGGKEKSNHVFQTCDVFILAAQDDVFLNNCVVQLLKLKGDDERARKGPIYHIGARRLQF